MNKNIKLLLDKAEELGWSIAHEESNHLDYSASVEFSKYSPAGQDFRFNIDVSDSMDAEDFLKELYEYYEHYDVSTEAYMWLDDDGHGKNGAPYDMKDVYEDMEACEAEIKRLYEELSSYEFEDEDEDE